MSLAIDLTDHKEAVASVHQPHPCRRLFFLDWLRILAFGALIVYHVGMYYVTWNFHLKSPFASHTLEPWMRLTEPWRMSLIFMISGAAIALMLRRAPPLPLLRQRSRRLLLPLLAGVLVVVPPQAYLEVMQKFTYTGSYLDFLKLYFTHYQGFCQGGHCLILPTWNHLWFLPYLWLYTAALLGCVALWPGCLRAIGVWLARALTGWGLLVWPVVLIFLVRWQLSARFPATHALLDDWFSHVLYAPMFEAGAAFAIQGTVWTRLEQGRRVSLVLALAGWALLVGMQPHGWLGYTLVAVFQWHALVAAFGYARRYLNRDGAWRVRLNEAVFPVYIVHQTILLLAAWVLRSLAWHPMLEGPLLVFITLSLSFASYEVIRRIGPLRPWFGLSSARVDRPTPLLKLDQP